MARMMLRFLRTQAKTHDTPTEPVVYPSGVFIHTEKGYFFVHEQGKRMRIISERVLASWSPQRIISTSEAAVAKYKVTSKIRFRNGSLIYSLADGKMYLIEGGSRRHIVNPDVLRFIGAEESDAVTVSLDEINLHPEGEPLT